jgi:hypothetical protein
VKVELYSFLAVCFTLQPPYPRGNIPDTSGIGNWVSHRTSLDLIMMMIIIIMTTTTMMMIMMMTMMMIIIIIIIIMRNIGKRTVSKKTRQSVCSAAL